MIDILTSYQSTTCCVCHISFAMTKDFCAARLKDKKSFYCPNGHSQFFISETEEEKLKKEVNRLENKIEDIRSCKRRIEYARRYWKGKVTKLRINGKKGKSNT